MIDPTNSRVKSTAYRSRTWWSSASGAWSKWDHNSRREIERLSNFIFSLIIICEQKKYWSSLSDRCMPRNLRQYILSSTNHWWINPTDMWRPKKIFITIIFFNTTIKLIIFDYLPLESRSSRQNWSETCEFLASKTLLTCSINLYQSSSYGPLLLEHKSHAAWRDEEISYLATYPECARCMVSSGGECGNEWHSHLSVIFIS
jgi:hypothetical protein